MVVTLEPCIMCLGAGHTGPSGRSGLMRGPEM
jgi:hypothetical protein